MDEISLKVETSSDIVSYENMILYLKDIFEDFDITKFKFDIKQNVKFDIGIIWSLDNQNWSNSIPYDTNTSSSIVLPNTENIYIGLSFSKQKLIDNNPTTLYPKANVENDTIEKIVIGEITYETSIISNLDVKTEYQLINQWPKWNFYDNQNITIKRWLNQCNSVAEMYGHTAIFFKTEPIESEIIHTFANFVVRNVCEVKKLKVVIPGNEIPQDRNVMSEWDTAMSDDFFVHIVDDKFKVAFGDKIPESKDYLYLPLLNKLFRVTAVQPKNGFMGKIGWWEVYLGKYEEDETVTFDDELKNSLSGFTGFEPALESMEDLKPSKQVLDELSLFKTATINTDEKLKHDTIEEKSTVTQGFTNKLIDSNNYISVKETEKNREFYEKRLAIVSVNPDTSAYPITMYNCDSVQKRVLAMQYNLSNYTINTKHSTIVNKILELSFNFVLLNKFVGEIIDLNDTNFTNITIEMVRKNLQINLLNYQEKFKIEFDFSVNELYYIDINFTCEIKQLAVKIFSILDKQKKLEYQQIYIVSNGKQQTTIPLQKLLLYGGNYLINDIKLQVDNNLILMDNVNPLLQMQNFG